MDPPQLLRFREQDLQRGALKPDWEREDLSGSYEPPPRSPPRHLRNRYESGPYGPGGWRSRAPGGGSRQRESMGHTYGGPWGFRKRVLRARAWDFNPPGGHRRLLPTADQNLRGEDVSRDLFPDHFYDSLPGAWARPPDGHIPVGITHLSLLHESGLMPTFSGRVENYPGFKSHFIVAVHRLPLPLFAKHVALRGILEKVPDLESFVATVGPGPGGYAAMIWELESRYGGRERLLLAHASAIKCLPTIADNNLANLEQFYLLCTRIPCCPG